MKQQLRALYELQKLDVEIVGANARLAALDGALALRKKHAAARKQSEAAHKALIDTEMELKDSELNLRTIDAKRAATEKKLYSGAIMSAREVTSLEHEIAHLKTQQGQLDGRVLELYESVESLRGEDVAAKAHMEGLEQQARTAIAKEAVERKRLEAELARLLPEREAAAAKIADKHLLSRYESIRSKSGKTGIAMILEHKCEGCHVAVTNFTIRNIFEDKGTEYCENCGRILMLDLE
jgi:predicted  nucleic acid-binding Zn-ribbon protein